MFMLVVFLMILLAFVLGIARRMVGTKLHFLP